MKKDEGGEGGSRMGGGKGFVAREVIKKPSFLSDF